MQKGAVFGQRPFRIKKLTKLQGSSGKSLEALTNCLVRGIDCNEPVYEIGRSLGTVSERVLVIDKYFFRNNSTASLTVLLTEEEGRQTVVLIPSGGGTGIWNNSWGANSSLAKEAAKLLMAYGLVEIR